MWTARSAGLSREEDGRMSESHGSVDGGEHWMALEGGADGSSGGGSLHEPVRRHRRLGSRAAAEQRRAHGEHGAPDAHRPRAADGHPRAPCRRRGRGLLHARARRGARRPGARGLCCGGPRPADRVEHHPLRRRPADAARAAVEPVAQGGARRPARDELRPLQRLRRDDDRRLHPQRPDPAGPDPARHGRQRRVHLTAGRQCRA